MNINTQVWVQLSLEGKRVYRQYIEGVCQYFNTHAPNPEAVVANIRRQLEIELQMTWLSFTLHQFMNTFGPHVSTGQACDHLFVEGEISLTEKK